MKMVAGDEFGATSSWADLRDAGAGLGPCRVVYLDDDEDYACLLKVTLERLGHQAHTFTNPNDALAAIQSPDAEYDAFIADFNLPGLCGIEVAVEARRCRPGLPRAVITNHIRDAQEVGSEADVLVLQKPSAPREFVDMLAHVLAGL
jgi:DNA-binding NtrC family response regulator